jgi:hypothetical protein
MSNIPSYKMPESYEGLPNAGDVTFLEGELSHLTLRTIEQGINLYHGTYLMKSYNQRDILLNDGTLLAIFSNNIKLAADRFGNCSTWPTNKGYLHKFRVKKDIPYIKVVDSSRLQFPTSVGNGVTGVADDFNLSVLEEMYCNSKENPKLNGFAIPIPRPVAGDPGNRVVWDYIIGLCNPNEYLEPIEIRECIRPYKLGTAYNPNVILSQ